MKSVLKITIISFSALLVVACAERGIREDTNPEYPDDNPTQEDQKSNDELEASEELPYEIELYGVLYRLSENGDSLFYKNPRIHAIDERGRITPVEVNQNGHYSLLLKRENNYNVYYSARGFYSKHISLDTYNIPDSVIGAGVLMPTDMTLGKDENEAVQDLLEQNPIGMARMMWTIEDYGWDFEYTDSLKREIQRLETDI